MQTIEKTYVTYLPYIYRNGKKYEVNAFTSIPRTKGEIYKLSNNAEALKFILDMSKSSIESLTFEIGQFVDSTRAKDLKVKGGSIERKDRLGSINTISTWLDSQEDDKMHVQSKTFVVSVYKLLKALDTLGVDISLKIDEDTQGLSAFVVHPNLELDKNTDKKKIK